MEEDNSQGDRKSKCLVNTYLPYHAETMEHREKFDLDTQPAPSSLPHLARILSILVIYGDSAFPGPGLLSKFQAVNGEVNVFLESAGSWLFSAQNSLHTKVTHFGETCSDPRNYGNTFDLSLSLHFVLW